MGASDSAKALLRALRARVDTAARADAVADEFERRVRRYCGEHGIPVSMFLGRALNERTTVTHSRDDDGQLVVTRATERDPEWLPEDVESAMRWTTEQDALCSGCRQPRRESFASGARYNVESHTCAACAAMGQKSWLANKNRSAKSPPKFGVYHTVTKAE